MSGCPVRLSVSACPVVACNSEIESCGKFVFVVHVSHGVRYPRCHFEIKKSALEKCHEASKVLYEKCDKKFKQEICDLWCLAIVNILEFLKSVKIG